MKTYLALFSTAALLATPLSAQAGFDSNVSTQLTGPVKIEVVLSDDLAHRADNLPRDMRRRGSSRLNSGFANNGFYGERDLDRRIDEMVEELTDDFTKAGVTIDDTAATVMRVTLVDVRPNRPTIKQLGQEPGLSFRSFGAGGAEIEGTLIAAGGEILGTTAYDFYPSLDPYGLNDAAGTWMDADRAISRFSKKSVKALTR